MHIIEKKGAKRARIGGRNMKSFKGYEGKAKQEEKPQTAEELTRKLASAYNGKSNADIFRSILSEAEKSKRAGTLSNEELETFFRTFSPMLDASQSRKWRAVIDKLKEI